MLQNPGTSELLHWLNISAEREQYHFLATHPALLDAHNDAILNTLLAQEMDQPQQAQRFRDALYLLQDARKRGGTATAIQEAYINMYGAFVLDLPAWLTEVKREHDALSKPGRQHHTAVDRMTLLRKALARAQQDPAISPEIRAGLHETLANALRDDPDTDRRVQSLEDAIAQCEMAM